MGLANLYHKRLVREPRPCCMCSKDTPVCLSNAAGAATDFLYCCESHLADFNFASPAPAPPGPPPVPQAEVDAVLKEFEEKKQRKKDKEAAALPAKGWISTGLSASASGLSTLGSATSSFLFAPEVAPSSAPKAPPPTTFVLHRHVFAMRVELARKKAQATSARARLEGLQLPSVPR